MGNNLKTWSWRKVLESLVGGKLYKVQLVEGLKTWWPLKMFYENIKRGLECNEWWT
jgi:hypothetical protein